MIAVYVLGALLWGYVLVRLLRRMADERRARKAHLTQIAERQRLWQADIDEATELYRQLRHAQCMAVLDRKAALAAAGE